MKTCLITGISGQDGAYLARLLLDEGHRVIGTVRQPPPDGGLFRLKYLGIDGRVRLEICDLTDRAQVTALIAQVRPDEIYNLAAQSSVGYSFGDPAGTLAFNIMSVLNLLEVIRVHASHVRLYQASSGEMFGKISELPVVEDMLFHPMSPYAASKASAHWMAKNYRESYGVFVSCGILFNHESYLRPPHFFVKKVLRESLAIARGTQRTLRVGNLDVRRDFGYAPDYVKAIWLMLQQDHPGDYLICSGRSILLRDIVHCVFDELGIPLDRMEIAPELFRPLDIPDHYGDNRKARDELGWHYDLDFFDVLRRLLREEQLNQDADRGPHS
jgi:GDPmannose 4,6-dehydratase